MSKIAFTFFMISVVGMGYGIALVVAGFSITGVVFMGISLIHLTAGYVALNAHNANLALESEFAALDAELVAIAKAMI